MKLLEFEDRVAELEKAASRDPGAFRRATVAFAVGGYCFPLAYVGLLTAVGIMLLSRPNALTLKLGVVVLYLAWVVLRSLWIRVAAPEGEPIQEADAPKLFAEIAAMRERVRGPKIDQVLLTPDLNAMISQVPRLGILGWHKNYLLLGLQYMAAVPPDYFRATLAHEMGHLSGSHGVMGTWIYRNRFTWEVLGNRFSKENLEESGWLVRILAAPFGWFYGWYAPRIAARTFVLTRLQEYEADAEASRAVSALANCEDLAMLQAKGSFINRYYGRIWDRAEREERPPTDSFSQLLQELRGPLERAETEQELRRTFALQTDCTDTHPCVRERWEAAGVATPKSEADWQSLADKIAQRLPETAAERYLPTLRWPMAQRQDEEFYANASKHWQEEREAIQANRALLAELTAGPADQLDAAQTLQLAALLQRQRKEEEALRLLQGGVARFPEDARLRFRLGEALLEENRQEGETQVQKAAQLDADFGDAADRALLAYYRRTWQPQKRRQLLQRMEERQG